MKITQEQFDQKLEEILAKMKADQLLPIPGVYELVAEEFNNEVIKAVEAEQEEDDDEA